MAFADDIRHSVLSLNLSELSGKNILVTGASGMIGSCLVKMLLEYKDIDFDVFASGRDKVRLEALFEDYRYNPHLHFFCFDVLEPFEFDLDFHFIIHAASYSSPAAFVSSPVEVIKSNIIGLSNLLEYGKDHGLNRLLYVSSGEVYGQGDGHPFSEQYSGYVDCTSRRSCYPASKRAAESLCVSFSAEYGVDTVIARPCHIYGPDFSDKDNHAYAQFIRNVVNGEDVILKSSGLQLRSWCYVVDCASALLTVLLKGNTAEAYNVADDGSSASIRDIAGIIADFAGKKVVFEIPLSTEAMGYNVVTESVLQNEKLKSLGWRPLFPLTYGLGQCVREKMKSTEYENAKC